ncbi:hypothetical protein ACFLTH_16390 [Bacteroidota bacterium]
MIKIKFKFGLMILLLLCIAILLMPFIIRASNDNPLFTGGNFYLNLRTSQDLSNGVFWDSLEDRIYETSLFHYLLSFLVSVSGIKLVVVTSIITGLLSVVMFVLIIKDLFEEKNIVLLSVSMLILSPLFLYLFTRINAYSFATLFSLVFIFFLMRNNYWSIPFLVLLSVTNFSMFIVNLLLLFSYYLYSREKMLFWSNFFISVITTIIFAYFYRGFIIWSNIFSPPTFVDFFTSFGAQSGIAFFYLFLGVLGLFTIWRRKSAYNYFLISFMVIFIFSLFNLAGRIALNFYLCVLSGMLIWFLIERKWAIDTIKKFTLLLILCGVIFSTSLYIDQLIQSEPGAELVSALSELKNQDEGTVLTHQSYGYLVEYFADKKSFLDDSSPNYENYVYLKIIEHRIFDSRNLDETEFLLKENNIKYLVVTPAMKKGLVWKRESEGLLFLIENTEAFNILHSNNGLWILEYKG